MAGQLNMRLLSGQSASCSGRHGFPPKPSFLHLGPRGLFSQCRAAVSNAAPVNKERKGGVSEVQQSKGTIDVNPPRGTRDFGPEEYRLRQWLFGHFEAVSALFGFEQFETPVLESEELFTRKAGEEITQQLYNFEDKGKRRVALRPELTPSLARLIISKGRALPLPAKWFTIGQCWRYERTTRGRRREHYQWNMDIVGVPEISAEAELLSAIVAFLERVGLGPADVCIKVSSRKVLQGVLARYGVPPESFGPVCIVVDKLDKMPKEKIMEELTALGVESSAIEGILAATSLGSVEELQQLLGNDNEAVQEIRDLFSLAEAAGCGQYLEFDPSVVRGLAYYTGIVFEGRDRAGQMRAIFGGGRYDQLLATLGGDTQPCAGFGFGDCVIQELLQEKGLLPSLKHQVEDLVVAMDEGLRLQATKLAHKLRGEGRRVDLLLQRKSKKVVMKHAERCGASRLYLLSPEDWDQGIVRVKELEAREESEVAVADLL